MDSQSLHLEDALQGSWLIHNTCINEAGSPNKKCKCNNGAGGIRQGDARSGWGEFCLAVGNKSLGRIICTLCTFSRPITRTTRARWWPVVGCVSSVLITKFGDHYWSNV